MKKYPLFICIAAFALTACGNPFRDEQKRNAGFTRIITNQAPVLQDFELEPWFRSIEDMREGWERLSIPTYEAMVFAFQDGAPSQKGTMRVSGTTPTPDAGHNPWVIPNGTYRFSMIGYTTANMGGAPICSAGTDGGTPGDPIVLNGGSKTITFTGSACSPGGFFRQSTPSYTSSELVFCSSAVTGKIITDDCTSSVASNVGSARIKVIQENRFASGTQSGIISGSPPSTVMMSGCLLISAGNGLIAGPDFPGGNPANPVMHLATHISVYSDTSCGTLFGAYEFPDGLAGSTVYYGKVADGIWNLDSTFAKWVLGSTPRLFLKQIP